MRARPINQKSRDFARIYELKTLWYVSSAQELTNQAIMFQFVVNYARSLMNQVDVQVQPPHAIVPPPQPAVVAVEPVVAPVVVPQIQQVPPQPVVVPEPNDDDDDEIAGIPDNLTAYEVASYKWARSINNELNWLIRWDVNFTGAPCRERFHLVYLPVQCGKTRIIVSISQISLVYKTPVVILVQNYIKDSDQLAHRFEEADKEKRAYFENKLDMDPVINRDLKALFADKLSDQDMVSLARKPRIIICLANGTQMKKLNNKLATHNIRYNLFMDESDARYKGDDTIFEPQMQTLIGGCDKFVGVTATAFDNLVKDDLKALCVFNAVIPANYKGFDKLELHVMQHGCPIENKYKPDADQNLLPEYQMMNLIQPRDIQIEIVNGGGARRQRTVKHPVICLHKTSCIIKKHNEIQQYFKNHNALAHWTSIIHNGNGIKLYSQHHDEPELEVITLDEKGHMARKDENGCYLFKNLQVQDMLEFLLAEGVEKHSHIVIIAGRTADRGTSYVSRKYRWHLTHEYLMLAVDTSSTVSSQIQALRICGISKDELPRTLITTQRIIDNCRAAIKIQDTWVEATNHNVEVEATTMHELMKATPIEPGHRVRCKLSKFSGYKHLLQYEQPQVAAAPQPVQRRNNQNIIDRFKELVLQDLHNEIESAKIRILRFLKNHAHATREEIETTCGIHIQPDYDKWNLQHHRYKIVIKNANNLYTINPEIEDVLEYLE